MRAVKQLGISAAVLLGAGAALAANDTPGSGVLTAFLKFGEGIPKQRSLAAFAIAALVLIISMIVVKPSVGAQKLVWVFAGAITLLGLVPIIVSALSGSSAASIYRIRVTVVSPEKMPVEDAKVWSTIGGEAKKVGGGWEFDVPAANRPADGKLTVFAEQSNAFTAGEKEIVLGADAGIAIAATVQLEKVKSAHVRGHVQDASGKTLGGAQVMVEGYAGEMIATSDNGGFDLPAHAASGQHVLVHVQKDGYVTSRLSHLAGEDPLVVELQKK